ncbi:polyprenyl synthetase family protein [Paenibacillus sp. strain BS8-2]
MDGISLPSQIPLNERIANTMRTIVQEGFKSHRLQELLILFTENKLVEPMIFGPLTYIHYGMYGGAKGDPVRTAAGMELLILASDILDDLEDQDAPSKPWMRIPLPEAIHIATSLLTLAQYTMIDSMPDQARRATMAIRLNEQLLLSADGQMMDIAHESEDETSYLEMVRLKSASLFVLACNAGVLAAGCDWNEEVASYGEELGLSSQLRNDVRDLVRWDEKSDFLQRKVSLPILYLLESVSEQDAWIADYYKGLIGQEDERCTQAAFSEVLERSGALLYGTVMGRMHYNRFQDQLASMTVPDVWKRELIDTLEGRVGAVQDTTSPI